jgi:hypothetical protein
LTLNEVILSRRQYPQPAPPRAYRQTANIFVAILFLDEMIDDAHHRLARHRTGIINRLAPFAPSEIRSRRCGFAQNRK